MEIHGERAYLTTLEQETTGYPAMVHVNSLVPLIKEHDRHRSELNQRSADDSLIGSERAMTPIEHQKLVEQGRILRDLGTSAAGIKVLGDQTVTDIEQYLAEANLRKQ